MDAEFERFTREYRARLEYYLRPFVGLDEVADLAQQTFIRLWETRENYTFDSFESWCAFARKVARNLAIDTLRTRKQLPPCVDLDRLPEAYLPAGEEILLACLTDQLYACANALWLGLDRQLPHASHRRQLLAAQRYYLEGEAFEEILEDMAAPRPEAEPPLTPERLSAWLLDPGVLRYLAFHTLYYPNHSLAGHLLRLGRGVTPALFTTMLRRAQQANRQDHAFGGMTWGVVALVLWRYAYAMTIAQILSERKDLLQRWEMNEGEISCLLDSFAERFPFSDQMHCLLTRLDREPGIDAFQILEAHGLWERLIFQYWYHDEVKDLSDLVARTLPAAQQVQVTINTGVLNMWVYKRLREKFVTFWRKHYEGED